MTLGPDPWGKWCFSWQTYFSNRLVQPPIRICFCRKDFDWIMLNHWNTPLLKLMSLPLKIDGWFSWFCLFTCPRILEICQWGCQKKSPVFFGPDIGGSSGRSGISIVSTSYASNPKNNPKNLYIFGRWYLASKNSFIFRGLSPPFLLVQIEAAVSVWKVPILEPVWVAYKALKDPIGLCSGCFRLKIWCEMCVCVCVCVTLFIKQKVKSPFRSMWCELFFRLGQTFHRYWGFDRIYWFGSDSVSQQDCVALKWRSGMSGLSFGVWIWGMTCWQINVMYIPENYQSNNNHFHEFSIAMFVYWRV